ncbi:MAG: 4-(cytidine 5'-diphospho)-2-C-methyl-D-erythritol kinase [Nitrosomonadaceae bacterium]|nr:4-(cytidine 5'-diphospho)-2-C-methyl-D-erythritol kinase [Nitrosomonadaceae bacterium]|tara:strand:- start:221 stop:1075 length:855 start_codon:yes stop_codon:yes gene_type:complete
MAKFVCSAPAKINLFLHVIGRRSDGYHLLQTVFRFLDFSDQMEFILRDDARIKLNTSIIGLSAKENLCVQAAQLLQKESGTSLGVEIYLEKFIPMGGGLGGGSSDAATTLLVLNHLWNLNWSKEKLMELGLILGADVPFFIFGESAFAEGIGEKLKPIKLKPSWYLILKPPVHVPTEEIFASKELTRNTIPVKIPPFSIELGHNDLESVVCLSYSEVARHLDWLRQLDSTKMVGMTGSGACVFAEFETESAAQIALASIPIDMSGFIAQGLDYHPIRELFGRDD